MKALILLLLLLPSLAFAYDCNAVKDKNERAQCKATQSRSSNQCSAISDYGKRQSCRVGLGDTPAVCNTVRDSWERAKCKAAGRK